MIFLHPLALIALSLAALPALLHLFHRRSPPEAVFPAVRYLTEAERQSARRLKLRHLLLLLLRTAIIVTVVLAAARPLVPTRAAGGTHPPTALAVVLDNSPSSGAVLGGQVGIDRLRSAARSVLLRAAAGDRIWLVLADGILRAGRREELLAALDSAPVDARRLDLVAAVTRAARAVAAEPVAIREVHVISDLQRTSLGSGRASIPAGVRVLALAPGEVVAENRGIASARAIEGAVAVSVVGTPGARVVPVTLRVGGRDVARALAGPGIAVTLALPSLRPGWWVGEVALQPDELRADDRRVIVWHAVPPPRARAAPAAGPFVAAALTVLRSSGRVTDGADVTIDERPTSGVGVVLPPADPARVGDVNRTLAARGVGWRFGTAGTPGPLTSEVAPELAGVPVTRRLLLAGTDSGAVLARVNGEPWAAAVNGVVLVGSRFDTAWTALPASPAFVPFVDALVSRFARGAAPVGEREGAPRVEFATAGHDTVGATVFGLDPRESDVTPAEPALVRSALAAEVLEQAELAATAFAGTQRADATGALLLFAILLALGEFAAATLSH